MKRPRTFTLVLAAAVILVALVVILTLAWYRPAPRGPGNAGMRARVEDVGLLTSTYLRLAKTGSPPAMSNLLSDIRRRGLKLNNPIPRDTSIPCYQIVTNATISNYLGHPDVVIIEENDNVADPIGRVRGLADGSVALIRKNTGPSR